MHRGYWPLQHVQIWKQSLNSDFFRELLRPYDDDPDLSFVRDLDAVFQALQQLFGRIAPHQISYCRICHGGVLGGFREKFLPLRNGR